MAFKKQSLATGWATATEVLDRLAMIKETRENQRALLVSFDDRVNQRRSEMASSLANLSPTERTSITARAIDAYRIELKRATAPERATVLRNAVDLARQTSPVAAHYTSPVQMLARESLGSERRSRILQQISLSGAAELGSLAEYAAATRDVELAAALCSRNSAIKATERSFSSRDLASAICGEEYEQVTSALAEIETISQEIADGDRTFATGRKNSVNRIRIAMMRDGGPSESSDGAMPAFTDAR